MTQIEYLLRTAIGLDASSIGSSLIQRTVRLRMKHLGLKRFEDYKRLVESSAEEWSQLVESVVVTETWFFRDREPFTAVVRLFEEWVPKHPLTLMRVLSLPCSSGEEPYSAAMALLDAGVPPDRFQIDAVDLSARALERAGRGIYGKNSFRGKDLGFRDRHFQQTKEGFLLHPAVRRLVRFRQANLLSRDFPANGSQYDVVFCRNLLIYFDRPTQHKAIQKLERLLAPGGTLFVGAAEQPLLLEQGFASANIPMAFACRKARNATAPARAPGSAPRLPERAPKKASAPELKVAIGTREARASSPLPSPPGEEREMRPARRAALPVQVPPGAAEAGPLAPPTLLNGDLDQARRLADAGKLVEAAAVCETCLRHHRASAQAYYLLGLVREAQGDASAADFYRKALYLEPEHYESLLHLALWAEKHGNDTRARAFKRRAARLRSST